MFAFNLYICSCVPNAEMFKRLIYWKPSKYKDVIKMSYSSTHNMIFVMLPKMQYTANVVCEPISMAIDPTSSINWNKTFD